MLTFGPRLFAEPHLGVPHRPGKPHLQMRGLALKMALASASVRE